MGWWIFLGILALILLLPLGASIFFDADGLRIRVIAGPVWFTVFPMKKTDKPAEKKEEKPVVKAEPEKQEKEKETKDIFASLSPEKPTGKTYAFYLSDENVNKLKKMAEKKGISASKLLDHILSEVL